MEAGTPLDLQMKPVIISVLELEAYFVDKTGTFVIQLLSGLISNCTPEWRQRQGRFIRAQEQNSSEPNDDVP